MPRAVRNGRYRGCRGVFGDGPDEIDLSERVVRYALVREDDDWIVVTPL